VTFPEFRIYNAQSKISVKISRTLKRIHFVCLMLTGYSTIFKNHNYATKTETVSILINSQFLIEVFRYNVVEQVRNVDLSLVTLRIEKVVLPHPTTHIIIYLQ